MTVDLVNGILDPMAGHGTFIAGRRASALPRRHLVIVPVMYGDGAADEADVVEALEKLIIWNRLRPVGPEDGAPLDVVCLSLGYYHETPGTVERRGRPVRRPRAAAVRRRVRRRGRRQRRDDPASSGRPPSPRDVRTRRQVVHAAPLVSVGRTQPQRRPPSRPSRTPGLGARLPLRRRRGEHDADGLRRVPARGAARRRPARMPAARHPRPRRLLVRVRGLERQLVPPRPTPARWRRPVPRAEPEPQASTRSPG